MANEVGRGYVDIVPDMAGFQERVGREVEQATSKASQRAQKALNFGATMTAAVTVPVAAAFGGAVKLASDLEQSVGAVESVFGDAAETIFEFGDTSAESFGLAREEVNRLGAVVGAQLKGMGVEADEAARQTVILQERAADLAATFGGTTSEAIQAISSLLRGERDPIERYGVSLKQADIDARIMANGLDTSTVAAEKQATIMASLELLLEGTADAAGQFGRESETLAGQQARAEAKFKDAAAALGTELLPIMTDAVEVASDVIDIFTGLPDPVQRGIVTLAGVGAAIGPISLAAGGAIKGVQGIKRAVDALRKARAASTAVEVADGFAAIGASAVDAVPSVRTLRRALVRGGIAAGTLAAAGHAVSNAFSDDAASQLNAISEEFVRFAETGEVTGSLAESLGSDLRFFASNADRILRPDLWQRGSDAIGTLSLGLFNFEDGLENAQTVMASFDEELAALVAGGNQDLAAQAFDRLTQIAATQGITVEELTTLLPGYAEALDDVAVSEALVGDEAEEVTEGVDGSAQAFRNQEDAAKRAQQALEDYSDAQRAATDPVFALNKALQDVDDAQQTYNETVEEYGANSEEARQAAIDVAEAVGRAELAAIDGDLSFSDFDRKLRDWVRTGAITAEQADSIRERVAELRGEAEDYSGSYEAYLLAETGTAAERIADLEQDLRRVTERTWTVTIDTQGGRVASPTGGPGGIPERAGGGPLRAGQLALVGEEGPEFFTPGQSGTVTSNDDSIATLADAIVTATERRTGRSGESRTSITNVYVDANGRDAGGSVVQSLREREQAVA